MLTTLAFAAIAQAATQQVDFSHRFEKGQKLVYEFNATGDPGGQDISAIGDITVEIVKVADNSEVEARFSCPQMDLGEAVMPLPDLVYTLAKSGLCKEFGMGDESAIYVIASLGFALPAGSLEEGSDFNSELNVPSGSYSSKGKFVGWEEAEGKRLAVLESQGELTPADDTPGYFKQKTWFDPESRRVVRSNLDIDVGDGGFSIEIKLKA